MRVTGVAAAGALIAALAGCGSSSPSGAARLVDTQGEDSGTGGAVETGAGGKLASHAGGVGSRPSENGGALGTGGTVVETDAGNDAQAVPGAGGSTGGSGGSAVDSGGSTVDPCDYPTGEHPIDCEDLCPGAIHGYACDVCSGLGSTQSTYFVFAGHRDRGCACDATYRIPIESMACARVTIQPGAHAGFVEKNCDTPVPDCLVVSSTGQPTQVFVTGPDRPAWVRFEQESELDEQKKWRGCPLKCP